jgi:hypothetical protein
MALSYTELARRIPIWLFAQNRDIVDEVAEIISEAENEVYRVLDHDAFRATLEVSIGTGGGDTSLIDLTAEDPPVFEARAMRLGFRDQAGLFTSAVPLERRELEFVTTLYPDGRTRRPRYYAEYDQPLMFRVFPQPDIEYQVQITLNQQPPRLVATTQETNVLTDEYPRVIEMACYLRGAEFMNDPAKIERWGANFLRATSEANAQIARRRRDMTGSVPQPNVNAAGT